MSSSAAQENEGKDTPSPQPLKYRSPSGLFRKLTTRLKPAMFHPRSTNLDITSPPKSPTQPSARRSAVPVASTDVAAMKRRRAALQQCGLVSPQRRDLSQLEAELDRRFSHVVVLSQDQQDQEELSSAERIRREWQAKNETQSEKQGDDVDPKDPTDAPSVSLSPERLGESDSMGNTEEQRTPEIIIPVSSETLLSPMSPVPLSPIPETFSFPDIPEEDIGASENEKEPLPPLPEVADPLTIPLPDSPLPSSNDLPDLPPTPTSRENKRPPPIVTANDARQTSDEVARGRSPNRNSVQSLASKQSLPALSPTMTASSSSSIPTPRDEESRERMEAAISRSNSVKSRFGKASDIRRDSEELDVVHETIPETSEHPAAEPSTWNPNRESNATMGSAGFEAFVEKRERRRMSTGIFQSSKRSSGSIRSSRTSTGSSMWSAIANDFALKPFDGAKSRSSTLPATTTSASESGGLTLKQSQPASEQPQPKITRSKSVIASLGLKMTRKAAQSPRPPSPPPSPMRRPTVRIVENREILMKEMKGIEDDESRRLTELAFMDF